MHLYIATAPDDLYTDNIAAYTPAVPAAEMIHAHVNSLPETLHGHVHFLLASIERLTALPVFHGNVNQVQQLASIGLFALPVLITITMFQTMRDTRGNAAGNTTEGPSWDPSGSIPFRTWVQEVHAWLNVTSSRLSPTAQAACIQRGLRGNARELAMATPPAAIALGAAINGVNTDPVTYLLHQLASRYSELEEERTMTMGRAVLDLRRRPQEHIDDLLAR